MTNRRAVMVNQDMKAEIDRLLRLLESEHLDRARKLARAGRHAEAETIVRNAQISDSGVRVSAVLLLAKLYAQQGKYEKAAESWNTILKTDPENTEAMEGLLYLQNFKSPSPFRHGIMGICFGVVLIAVAVAFYWTISADVKAVRQELAVSHQTVTNSTIDGIERINKTVKALHSKLDHNQKQSVAELDHLTLQLARQLTAMQKAIELNVHGRLEKLDQRIDLIENSQISSQSHLKTLNEATVKMSNRLVFQQRKLEGNIQKSLNLIKAELESIRTGFDVYAKQIQGVEQANSDENKVLQNSVAKLDQRLEKVAERTQQLTKRMDDIKFRIFE